MATGQRIGYVRVSTVEQNPARQLADQRDRLDKVFIDHASGRTIHRPQWQALRQYVREGDTVQECEGYWMKVVDLFAGCGGMSLGFKNAGFDIIAAVEHWDKAILCYQENFSHPVHNLDLHDHAEASEMIGPLSPDIIIGGPPCQDFSHAGKRLEGERADLTLSFAKIVASVKPMWFVMENVDRIVNSNAYQEARTIFVEAGYGLTEQVLDASLCGVPQKRKRFFSIGRLGSEDGFLESPIKVNLRAEPMTIRGYLGGSCRSDYFYCHPRNYSRRAIFSVDEPSPTIRGVNRPVPSGYHGHPGDASPLMPSVQPLTTLERAQIQTFPEQFQLTSLARFAVLWGYPLPETDY